jgi:hypothetical protein
VSAYPEIEMYKHISHSRLTANTTSYKFVNKPKEASIWLNWPKIVHSESSSVYEPRSLAGTNTATGCRPSTTISVPIQES